MRRTAGDGKTTADGCAPIGRNPAGGWDRLRRGRPPNGAAMSGMAADGTAVEADMPNDEGDQDAVG